MLLLYNAALQVLARAVREGKQTKGIQVGKKELELSVFASDLTMLKKILRNHKKKLEQISKFVKGDRIKDQYAELSSTHFAWSFCLQVPRVQS